MLHNHKPGGDIADGLLPEKVSGSAGEMIVGPKTTLFLDEISTGLDSSTTFLIVKCMRNFVHLQQATVMMALLQPQPEVYDLFDEVMLLAQGLISSGYPPPPSPRELPTHAMIGE